MKLVILLLVLVTLSAGCISGQDIADLEDSSENTSTVTTEETDNAPGDTIEPTTNPRTFLIEMTDSGFSPKVVEISSGDTVIFRSIASRSIWPASDDHPSHTNYPESARSKCPSSTIFDACDGITSGGEWSFTFNEVGEWGYHDHLRSTVRGTVTVK